MYRKIYDPSNLKLYNSDSNDGKDIIKEYMLRLKGGSDREQEDKGVACMLFGRFQPPHYGHGDLINLVIKTARRNNAQAFLFTSQKSNNSGDPKTIEKFRKSKSEKVRKDLSQNPIKISDKLNILRELHQDKDIEIVDVVRENIKNPFHAVGWLKEQGYSKIIFMAGTDRFREYSKSFSKDNQVEILELGRGEESVSGTKVRKLALETLVKNIEKLEYIYNFSMEISEEEMIQLRNTMELYSKIKGKDVCYKNINSLIKLVGNIQSEIDCMDNIRLIKDIVDLIHKGNIV